MKQEGGGEDWRSGVARKGGGEASEGGMEDRSRRKGGRKDEER